jgi:hypothetical protein
MGGQGSFCSKIFNNGYENLIESPNYEYNWMLFTKVNQQFQA